MVDDSYEMFCCRNADNEGFVFSRCRRHSVADDPEDDGCSSCSTLTFLGGGCVDYSSSLLELFLSFESVQSPLGFCSCKIAICNELFCALRHFQ